MIRLTRSAQLLDRDAGRWYTGFSDRSTRVYVVRSRGLRVDAAMPGSLGPLAPRAAQLNIQLAGTLLARRSPREHAIAARSIAIEPSVHWNERWIGPLFRVLVIEWESGCGPMPTGFSLANLSERDHERVSAIADTIERDEDTPRVAEAIERLDALLRSIGLRIDGLDALARSTESDRDIATARMLSKLRTSLHAKPAWIDAVSTTQRSERQLRRDVDALTARLNFDIGGLRSILFRERVISATQLLTARATSVAAVARSVGFGTSRALGLALDRAGFPSASTLAALARDD
ncbi:MAG: hypothetical protein JNK05_36050 [Myxococcales bacterium]|nr:hypothetical protein [Myxococcales bacterium]